MSGTLLGVAVVAALSVGRSVATRSGPIATRAPPARATSVEPAPAVFRNTALNTDLKLQIFSLAAALDRGQSYNPTSSDAYKERLGMATSLIRQLSDSSPPLPTSLEPLDGGASLPSARARPPRHPRHAQPAECAKRSGARGGGGVLERRNACARRRRVGARLYGCATRRLPLVALLPRH